MAIAKIKKLELIGLSQDKDKILSLLQKMEIAQIIKTTDGPELKDHEAGVKDIERILLEMEEAITYLETFQEKKGIFQSIIQPKPVLYEQELQKVIAEFDYQGLLRQLSAQRNRLKDLFTHKERLIQERHILSPWRRLKIPLDQLHGNSQHCAILLGILPAADCPDMIEECGQQDVDLFYECLNNDQANAFLLVVYLKEEFERLESILKKYRFNFITLSRHRCTAEERILEVNREIMLLDGQMQEVKERIADFIRQQFKLMAVYDYLSNIKNRRKLNKDLPNQQFTFALSAWIKHRDAPELEEQISKNFKDAAIFISEPKATEEVPVDLENKPIIQPFEFITKIYGFPKYGEIDPTPYLAPFFFLYFGFCISDAGYGVILFFLSWCVLKKFKLGPQGKRFFRLFLFCGVSTVIAGIVTGSWFGNLIELLAEHNKAFSPLKQFKDSLVILDPMKEPTKLLGVALSFGIFQVWFGNIVAAIGNIKNRRYLDIVLDQVPTFIFLFGLTGLGMIFLKLLDGGGAGLFKYSALAAGLALVLTQGRSEKGLGAKLFYGIYYLYNALSGYLSDILSYSRLWALGLVTGVMATTINLISLQFSQIFTSLLPFIDKINFVRILISSLLLITIFTLGHLMSFLMNLLGAFVHPVRLQFVEFFSKFFKPGGNAFKPLKVETRYINIE